MSTIFTLRRSHNDGLSTIGQMFAPDGRPMNLRLEPGPHTSLHPRIAAGQYAMTLRAEGGKWAEFRKVPELHDLIAPGLVQYIVPGRAWILDHPGNFFYQTLGCTMPGKNFVNPGYSGTSHWEVERSRAAFAQDYPVMRDAIRAGDAFLNVLNEGA